MPSLDKQDPFAIVYRPNYALRIDLPTTRVKGFTKPLSVGFLKLNERSDSLSSYCDTDNPKNSIVDEIEDVNEETGVIDIENDYSFDKFDDEAINSNVILCGQSCRFKKLLLLICQLNWWKILLVTQ